MLKENVRFLSLFIIATSGSISSSCSQPSKTSTAPLTVAVSHSPAKFQAVGNCWIYAFVSWTESMKPVDEKGSHIEDVSESYLFYRSLQEYLNPQNVFSMSPLTREGIEGGDWKRATDLAEFYGIMREKDFLPQGSTQEDPDRQEKALNYVMNSVQNGKLKNDRSENTVVSELDRAFQVDISSLAKVILPAANVNLARSASGKPRPLALELTDWTHIQFSTEMSDYPDDSTPAVAKTISPSREAMLVRVKRALGKSLPVVMGFTVDFNAYENGVFSLATLKKNSKRGTQGGHMVTLADFTSQGKNPETGEIFSTTEGEVSEDTKQLAIQYGQITSLIGKNSWGTGGARATYTWERQPGYVKFEMDYILGLIPTSDTSSDFVTKFFVLPPGY
jgi:hypothetical protein